MGTDTFHLATLLRAPSSLTFNISRDEEDFIKFLIRASFSAHVVVLEKENKDRNDGTERQAKEKGVF